MLEDDIYRTSTQFRLWSFTEDSLRSIRANTNAVASERVRAAVRRAREARQQASIAPTPDQGTQIQTQMMAVEPLRQLEQEQEASRR
ncbi:hypothetical protein HL42_2649 [Trichophyton rubrum]|nr:hypothetical protein HL42_2649 [Trichophyton rubrum]